MKSTSAFVLSLFLYGEAEAIKYRPYVNGDTPWYKPSLHQPKDEFPINYPVPDFGEDKDIIETRNSINLEEKRLKHKMKVSWG